ncbi:2-succinyl-6-hydroxy-2,4-cyclohexadiene-1-carboxylate synthase [Psychromonas sp. RZ22]|uniref:2-succinyl-6-hydroxy-2, 4-cyclohexadiene-1-carboxylate synthase n=1 Tax=Psychromonas algarum TaxID=2555643 RepID=UPI0010672B73|nr:2-succinyl-6-hydroxy-2,4-cyclohexadiene-1-carboxylate synthase [Psychromonas sp. RZ22]TEW53373.1 2-succinyl-6-hydroxy-2,4-cyclohexadiene-1-carboxylate synthase [Psychromonas sp. RZ22]
MPLYSEQQGSNENPTLVFLHGFLGNRKDWQTTIDQLKDSFHCVTIDLPGHGRSVATTASITNGFENCHKLIAFTLEQLNIQAYSLIGYSLGGRIALDYARSQNDPRLQHLILESSHIGLDNETDKTNRYQFDLAWAERFATQSVEESLYQWYEQAIFDDLNYERKDFIIEQRSHNYGVPLASMLLSTSLAHQVCASTFLAETKLPITYFYGQKDIKFKQLAESIPATDTLNFHCFNGLGHNTHQHAPVNYANNIKKIFI